MGKKKNAYTFMVGKHAKEKGHLEDLGVEERI
jgi:hypothetical protein